MTPYSINSKLQKILIVTCFFLNYGCASKIDYKQAEQYIRESEKQWAESAATGDSAVIRRILADDFIGIDPDGKQYNKQKMIEETTGGPKYILSGHLNEMNVRFYGNTAVAQGNETWVSRSENEPHPTGLYVWTDTWILRDNKWQVVAAEDLVVHVK
jgi:Domain of unknown function (DUF4440)